MILDGVISLAVGIQSLELVCGKDLDFREACQ